MRYKKCIRCSRTVGWVGLVSSAVLMVMKAFVGLVSGSQAMVADAMYSAKDLVSSLMVIVGMSMSEKTLDREHPYGHGKVEFILSMFVSIIFLVITASLMVYAVGTLFDDTIHPKPHLIALWAAFLCIAVNMSLYYYSRCVSIESNSPLVRTLSKHHHADAASSAAVACGIIGSHYFNMPWIDTAVAALETAHLMYLGGDVFWDSAKGLMDRNIEDTTHNRIKELVEGVEGVEEVTYLRSRYVGQDIFSEVIIGVDSGISVMAASAIAEAVKQNVAKAIPRLGSFQVRSEGISATAMEKVEA